MAVNSITSANVVYMLAIVPIFPVPQKLEGFMADQAFDAESVESGEVVIGVDGFLSAGYTFYTVPQTISIMPNSPASNIFEQWMQYEKVTREKIFATASLAMPTVGKKYTMTNGVLTRFMPHPPVRRVLEGRPFTITWGDVTPALM